MNTLNYLSQAISSTETIDNVGKALEYSSSNAVFGFAVVFAALILIWGVVWLMKVFFYTLPNAKNNTASSKNQTAQNSVVSNSAVVNVQNTDSFSGVVSVQDSNASIAAAIIAAVSAFRAEHGESVNGFRVVSFKKRK